MGSGFKLEYRKENGVSKTMIKSIKEIKNIGVFSDFKNGGSKRFEKLTFIYGLNTYGKTTITEIFNSLKNDDSSYILNRKTIPEINYNQKVIISIIEDLSKSERDLNFKNDNWDKNIVSNKIEIFGTDFIHKNLFTGLQIERNNKENFTQFILGEQGVILAEKIKTKRQGLTNDKKNLSNTVPHFVKNKSEVEIKKFINYPINYMDLDKIKTEIAEKNLELNNEQDRIKEPSKILNLSEPKKFDYKYENIIDIIDSINKLLIENYENIKEDSFKQLEKHLKNNFMNNENAENWIKTGLNYCKDHDEVNCPFCGQKLGNARELINLYNNFFDENYIFFIRRIEEEINVKIQKLEDITFINKSTLQTCLADIAQYNNLIKDSEFQTYLKKINANLNLIDEESINTGKSKILKAIKISALLKNKSPYKKIEEVNIDTFKNTISEYYKILKDTCVLLNSITVIIKEFKNKYKNTKEIQKNIEIINNKIKVLEYKKARIELYTQCKEYIKAQNVVTKLDKEIIELEKQLQADQSEYIKKYFVEINKLFKIFGSRNFTLKEDIERRGYFPVYSIKIKYHNKLIPNAKLYTIFSESDRRALSLAVFWAKIILKDDTEKKKTIIILDDPVTSFDNNRIFNSINCFKTSLNTISQLIILTHYENFIKQFVEMSKFSGIPTQYLEILQNNNTSYLSKLDIGHFIACDYQKIFLKIYGFINRFHSDCILTDLRPFLENLYLPKIFAKQIYENKINGQLNEMIDSLFKCNCIDEIQRRKLHEFRETLNPYSHLFTTNNEEDIRNFAIEMIDFLYSLRFEASL